MSTETMPIESSRGREDDVIDKIQMTLKSDEAFAQFMGQEMVDLDKYIAPLVYALWKTQLVHTQYSCEGHAEHSLLDAGVAKMPGHFVYMPGYVSFKTVSQEHTDTFLTMIHNLSKQYPFVSVRKDRFAQSDDQYSLFLSMEDIRTKPDPGVQSTTREVPEALAQERIRLFKQFWKELTLAVWAIVEH